MAIDSSFFRGNRQRLLAQLPGTPLVVLTAFARMQRKADAAFLFEQEGHFWYLSGIEEPNWLLIIDAATDRHLLVMPELEDWRRIFDGGLSPEEALSISGADGVLSPREAAALLREAAAERPVYTLLPDPHEKRYGFVINPAQALLTRRLRHRFGVVNDCRDYLKKLRAIKQPQEIEAIQAAIDVTVTSLHELLPRLAQMKSEREVEAYITYRFQTHGADGHAYDPIVAAGKNACTLHYVKNDARLGKDDWLLLDVGAKKHGYAADITRSLPLGEVTPRQRDVYQAVTRVHDAAMGLCRPGVKALDYHHEVQAVMVRELEGLGLVKDSLDAALHTYFPHAVSHGLGIDVHDSLAGAEAFEAGMVLTVEPGIYIPDENIGIRIENDILITENGPRNLSVDLTYELDALKSGR